MKGKFLSLKGRFALKCSSLLLGAAFVALAPTLPEAAEQTYVIGEGDTLSIKVFGEEGLSGSYRVGPGSVINYPLVGAFSVEGLTTGEAARQLAERVSAFSPNGRSLMVEVAEYAPVYVVGDVERPGALPFRPRMIVLELLALAGGLRRVPPEAESSLVSLIGAQADLGDLRLSRFSQLTQKARLEAEMNGSIFDGSSVPLDELVALHVRRQVINDEKELFRVRLESLVNQEKTLKSQRDGYNQEISSLTASIALHDSEVTLLEQELATAEQLLEKGMTVQPRVLGLRRELSAVKRNALDFRLALARAKQRQLEIDQRISEVRTARIGENAQNAKELNLSIARTEQKIATTIAMLSEMQAKVGERMAPRTLKTVFTLTRRNAGQYASIEVDDLTDIRPGDILRVERRDVTRQNTAERPAQESAPMRPAALN
jgi:polysaccharide export outer membrane protein